MRRTLPFLLASLLASPVACGGPAKDPSTSGPKPDKPGDGPKDEPLPDGAIPSLGSPAGPSGNEVAMTGPLRAFPVEKDAPVKLDGVLKEWHARSPAKTGASPASLSVAIQYDDQKLYVAGEVSDPAFVRTAKMGDDEDHAELVLAFPGPTGPIPYGIGLWAGKPGETAGTVKHTSGPRRGQEVTGAKIVEAPAGAGGYTFEAAIPWSTFPEARTLRVGMRGVVRYHDVAKGGAAGVIATGPGDAGKAAELPGLPTDAEHAVVEGLLQPKGLAGDKPRFDLFVDVWGDAMKERVSVFGRYFTICGPSYRGGKQFFFRDLGGEPVRLEAREITGRDKQDLLIERRFTAPTSTRQILEVWSLLGGEEPVTIFAQEVAIVSGAKKVSSSVRVGNKEIEVRPEPAVGWDAGSFREGPSADVEALLFPWGAVKSRTYRFDGGRFTKASEVAQAPTAPPPPPKGSAEPALPRDVPTPPVKPGAPTGEQVFAQYKKDQSVPEGARPKFELTVNVAEDPRPERVVLVGRDLVVWGPGFRNGAGYTFLTLSQFEGEADVAEVTARDMNGDGAAEILVRGTRHLAPQGGGDKVAVSALFVYEMKEGRLARIFGIETGRELGPNRVQGLVQMVPARSGKGFDFDVRPGVAKGWTEKTWPFPKEQPGAGAPVEPLLLPWGGVREARYTYTNGAFTLVK